MQQPSDYYDERMNTMSIEWTTTTIITCTARTKQITNV